LGRIMSVEITFICNRCKKQKTQRGAIYCACQNNKAPFCSECTVCPTETNTFVANGIPLCRDCYGNQVDSEGWIYRDEKKYRLWDKKDQVFNKLEDIKNG
jgi:hypothetical protein